MQLINNLHRNSSNNWLSSYPTETKQQQLYSMAPELSFNWGININHNSEQEDSRTIKDELAEHYYRNYSEILSSSSCSSSSPAHHIHQQHNNNNLQAAAGNDVATKFLLKSLSSYDKIPDFYSTCTPSGGSLDMNLEALDLLASSRFSSNSQNQIGMLRDGSFSNNYAAFDNHIPFYTSNKVTYLFLFFILLPLLVLNIILFN